jgi:hypothetical protein
MTTLNKYQLHREAVEFAAWQTPSLTHPSSARSRLASFDAESQDQSIGNCAIGDGSQLPSLGSLSSFESWESVASTIVHKVASLSNFNPGATEFDPVAWGNFLQKFSTLPFLMSFGSGLRELPISPLSLEGGIAAVKDLGQNLMTPENFGPVVTTIKKMGQLALESAGATAGATEEKSSNQQLGLLSRKSSRLYLGIARTGVVMQYKPGKGYEQIKQMIGLHMSYGTLDFDKCQRYANMLLQWDRQGVDDWVNGTASASKPPNNSPAWGR